MINAMYYAYFGGRGSGVFTSEAFSAPCGGKITRLSYEADTLGGSRIYIELAASTDSINWTDWFEVVPDGSIPAPVESGPYYKYRVGMARGTRNDRPVLHSITWHFELFAPELVLALPPPNSFYSCSCGAVIWDVRCESKIELPSASVLTNSITYGPSRCTWNSVDSTFQFLGPEACWTHGETYSGVILELTAESGCRRLGDTTFTFTADFRPPIITNISPLPDTLMANSSPILCATIYDSTSDEYDSTMFWVINGDTSRFGEPGISWNNATGELTMDLASAGLSVVDTVLVCVGAGDIAVGCGTNMTDSCWSFIVDTTSPQCFPICPLDGWIVGCDSFHILFYLDDQYGIAYSTVEFSINGAAYDTSSPEVTLRGDTIDFYTSEPWSNNDTVNVQVTAGEDNAGNVLATPCHFSFVIDLSPPIITPLTPLDGATIETKQPLISALITDTYGIASDSLVLCAAGDCWGYDSLPAGLSWSEDTLSFDPVAAGYYFLEETVNIIVSACDSTQWCGPNCTDTTWTFTIADDDTIYPVWIDYTPAMWLEDSIFTVVCRAYDESGIYTTMPPDTQAPYLIWDNDGELSLSCDTVWLDFVSESAGTVTLSSSAPLISADADSDIVFVATCWDNDFDLSLASDRLRTDSPLWPVEILTRAKVEMTMPHPEWITSCTDQGIRFSIEGEVSINFESCIFVIDNDTVTFSDPELSMEGDSVIVYTPPGNIFDNGPIICKLIEAKDAFGHSLSVPLEWTFYVDADPPRFELIRPEDGAMVPEDDYGFTVTIVDSGSGLDTACIEFTVVVDGDSFTYTMDSICVNWNGLADELSFFPENSHLSTRDGDSLAILLCACDVPDLCPPNIGCIDFAYWIEPDVKCSTNTDPFTPNRDGYNDEVVFFWPRFYSSGAEISIYDMRGIPVRRYSVPPGDFKTAAWDGQDDNNRKCPAGVYIYIIEVDGKRICKGTITLAR